jgi:hypothetical protein
MILVQAEFQDRQREITRYFDFLRHYDQKEVVFQIPAGATTTLPDEADDLFKTLKANGFLLLYNLIESTLKNAIEAIFDEFKTKGVSFDQCRLEVRQLILRNLRKHNVQKIAPSLSVISTDIVIATFRKDELASGNVDARFVRELASHYGFAPPNVKSDELLTVKTNRNDLAHGLKSFAEVGRDFDLARLEQIKSEVMEFLTVLLDCIAEYITNKGYLTANAGA